MPPQNAQRLPEGISLSGTLTPEFAQILTPEALAFVVKLHRAGPG